MTNPDSASAFLAARDFLFAHREDYDTAYRDFRWPVLDRFNWALDYFDAMAQGNHHPALWIVNEGGAEIKLSFAEMSARSNHVANYLRALGVQRGDRVLLMLGNVAPLWECMLAAMKLGAVIIPATTLLTRDDLLDRFERGRVRHALLASTMSRSLPNCLGITPASRSAGRRPVGATMKPPMTRRPYLSQTVKPVRPTRCCCISPRAQRQSQSWFCTVTRAILSAIWRRCTGSDCDPVTTI
jgi:hypothetical protein